MLHPQSRAGGSPAHLLEDLLGREVWGDFADGLGGSPKFTVDIAVKVSHLETDASDHQCLEHKLSGKSRENAKNGAVSLRTRNLTGDLSPGGIPLETHCLQSESPPASMAEMAPAGQPVSREVEGRERQPLWGNLQRRVTSGIFSLPPQVQVPEAVSEDPDSAEVFYTVERDESGEVICLWSDMEAYNKIAALAEYLLKDQQDAPVDEHFESLFWEVGAAEGPGGCTEAKTWGPSSEAPEAKRQRLAHPPALCIVSRDPLITPLSPGQDGTDSPGDFHVQILVASMGPAGRSPEALGPSANGQLWCIPRHRSNIQMIFTFENAQQPCLPADAPTCPGSVRAFCKRLKEHFRRECCPGPGQPPGHLYLERDLVQHHLDSRGGRSADLRRCHLGEKGEASLERSRLFQGTRKPGLGSRVIMVLGKAGTGKSLLVQKICLDWANGRMPQFDFVFRFDCRRLSLLQGSYHNFRALLSDSLGGSCQGIDDVYDSLLQKPERLLLLFDGMEDLKEDPEGFSAASGCPAGREAHGLGSILAPLFQRKMFNGCTFLLTGRPKERLPQCFPRVDSVLEVVGFSPEQASHCLAGSFEGSSHWELEANLIRSSPYLFSLCCNPGLCQFIGQAVFEMRGQALPSTLTGLFATYLLQKVASSTANSKASRCQAIPALAEVSWSLGQRCQRALLSEQFPSADVKELALKIGLMVEQRDVCVFSNFAVQNFLVALHLTLDKEIKGKKLTKYLGLGAKFRRFLSSWDLVPRFLSGLLFLKDDLSGSLLFGKEGELDTEKMITRKQRSLSRFIRKLSLRDFSPDKLLELLHCVHETQDQALLKHLTLELMPDLSFMGFSLAPPDVSVLHAVLGTSSKKFSLDLRGSGVHLDGLRKLVDLKNVTQFRLAEGFWSAAPGRGQGLQGTRTRRWEERPTEQWISVSGEEGGCRGGGWKNILKLCPSRPDPNPRSSQGKGRTKTAPNPGGAGKPPAAAEEASQREGGSLTDSFCRVSLGEAVGLWKHLWDAQEREALQAALEKFLVEPFRAKTMGDVDALLALVQLQRDMVEGREDSAGSGVHLIPAIAGFLQLEFSLGPSCGLEGFRKLVDSLVAFSALQHLDLDSPDENEIGDEGLRSLTRVLPRLASLETLNLSRNKISDLGAELLAGALPSLRLLKTLSLYENNIGDAGAERVAEVLPQMCALRPALQPDFCRRSPVSDGALEKMPPHPELGAVEPHNPSRGSGSPATAGFSDQEVLGAAPSDSSLRILRWRKFCCTIKAG
ncbi:hypothetical protein E2320_012304 [Naja naja]|nr:hypothetical protein E2320_012304 [Naja naja]